MNNLESEFSGRVAIVTGGTSGIGAATVREFVSLGARVLIADIVDEAGAAIAEELGEDKVSYVHTDVSNMAQVQAMVEVAEQTFGRLDILVNNAGIGCLAATPDLAAEEWHRVLGVNLDAVFFASKAAIPIMRRQGGGAIVNTASISGMAADYHMTAYAASKGAVINYTRALAIDHAQDNIRVNAVCPGLVSTGMTGPALSMDPIREQWTSSIPMQRASQPEEIARVIRFLASDDASYMTGSIVAVDGGLTAWTGQPNISKLFGLS